MTCDELSDLLADFVAGELAIEVLAVFEQHVVGCPNCGRSVDTYRLTIRVTRCLGKCDPLPPAFEQRLRAALANVSAEGRG